MRIFTTAILRARSQRKPQKACAGALALLLPALLSAQEALYSDFSQVQGTFQIQRGYQFADGLPLEAQVLAEREPSDYAGELLELSRQWFSGMIFGYEFSYRPSDSARRVVEEFLLEPIHQIPWGAEGLEYTGYALSDERVEMSFRYITAEHEVERLRAWRSRALVSASGFSQVPDNATVASRMQGLEGAVRSAIRSYFGSISRNKPKVIRGRVALVDLPRSVAAAGLVNTRVRIAIETLSLEHYEQF